MKKKLKLLIAILVGSIVYLLGVGFTNALEGKLILVGISVCYFLATLRFLSTKDIFAIAAAFLTMFLVSLATTVQLSDSNVHFIEALKQGSFLGFFLFGGPIIFGTMFMMKKRNIKKFIQELF